MKVPSIQMLVGLITGSIWFGPSIVQAAELPATFGNFRPQWQISQSEQISFGFTDNVMLSAFAPQRSAFGQASAELLLLRPILHGWEFSGFIQGNLKRFQDRDAESRQQSEWFGRIESRWVPVPALSLRAVASFFGESSLMDLSETAASRLVVLTRVQGISATANVRIALSPSLSLVVATRPSRNDYRTFAGDFTARENFARVEWQMSRRILAGFDWRELRRDYLNRSNYTAGGRALPGTHLSIWQSGGDVNLTLFLDPNGKRKLTLSAGQTMNQDRASGYYDYRQNRSGVLVAWNIGSWHFSFDGQLKRDVFSIQTGGIGIFPPPRFSAHLQTEIKAERVVSRRWSLFCTLGRDDFDGNLDEFNYNADSTSLGLRYTH